MKNFSFVTIGDKDFFHIITHSVKQVKKFYPEATFYIYDWGFNPQQVRRFSREPNVIIIDWKDRFTNVKSVETTNWQKILVERKLTRASTLKNKLKRCVEKCMFPIRVSQHKSRERLFCQKPYCLLDCANRCKGSMIYLDGDAFLINKVDELMDFDIGVTLRRKNEITNEQNNCQVLNAGVIIFGGSYKKNTTFIKEWINTMHSTHEYLIEQTALTRMIEKNNLGIYNDYYNTGTLEIEGMRIAVKILPCEIYNYNWIEEGVDKEKVKIVHFKNNRYKDKELVKSILD